jgi:hypothetical protein
MTALAQELVDFVIGKLWHTRVLLKLNTHERDALRASDHCLETIALATGAAPEKASAPTLDSAAAVASSLASPTRHWQLRL